VAGLNKTSNKLQEISKIWN